jgi:hypothetical protein
MDAMTITKLGNVYKVVNGTYYNPTTPDEVIKILEDSRINHKRIHIHYGNTITKQAWGDSVKCRIGRSTGEVAIPLAIKTKRSIGGEAILDACIVKIEYVHKKNSKVLYEI